MLEIMKTAKKAISPKKAVSSEGTESSQEETGLL